MRISDWSSDVCSSDLQIVHCVIIGVYVNVNLDPLPQGERGNLQAARTSATFFFAASPRSFAATHGRPELARMSFPFSTFGPSTRNTTGPHRLPTFSSATMPYAVKTHFMLPTHMLTSRPLTSGS